MKASSKTSLNQQRLNAFPSALLDSPFKPKKSGAELWKKRQERAAHAGCHHSWRRRGTPGSPLTCFDGGFCTEIRERRLAAQQPCRTSTDRLTYSSSVHP
jgi:hypothetical protein